MIRLNEYDITAAFKAIEDELIASMIRNMDRHRAEETKEGIEWSMWQAEQLKTLEKYKRENQKKYKKEFRRINKEIDTLIRQARETGNMEQELEILAAIKAGFKGAKKASPGATAEFFRLNDRKLEALIEATTHDMERAEVAVLRKADDDYRKAIYNAQVYANTGAGTYEKAVDMATKDMLSRGLNCIEYANGARHTLPDYADMAIRTASKRAYLQGEGEKRQEWGISTVIVNKRGNPCPKCLPFCGKVLIDDVWSGGPKDGVDPETGKKYPLMSTAIAHGLYHPRCKDSHTTYFPGISTADDTWTEEELEAIGQNYEAEQRQQYAARQAEKYGRLAGYSLDEENQKRYAARRDEWKLEQAVPEEKQSSYVPAKTIEEAQKTAEHLGVKYAVYDNLSLDMANELNSALETIPEDIRPVFVGDSASLESYRGAKLPRNSNHFYGVHIDVPPEGLLLGRDSSGRMQYDFEVQGQMVGISKKFNSAEKIAKSKVAEQKKYVQKHENRWFFNEDGRSTPYHEMGHVYADAKGIPYGFERDAERWARESGCDVLKNKTEAWCEAWGAYHTNNPELPDYIAKYIESATEKPIAKTFSSGIITSGARIIDPDSDAGTKFAKMYYKEIRSFSTDSKKIAKNLGKSEKEIKQIKEYLFETGFDPDCAIAQSWQRLMEGKDIKPHDRTLIEHELLEMRIKSENPEIEHWKAHEIATKKYDYQNEAGVYYGNLEKHKKNK